MISKVVRDGKVAVLYSPGFGAGWYTWNPEHPEIVFDPMIVDFIENGDLGKLENYMTMRYPGMYLGGLGDLTIEWIPEGTLFRIHEYDGNESIEIKEDLNWMMA